MARDDFCTFGGALGTFRRFPDIPTSPKNGGTAFPSLLVCVRVRSCAYLCAGKRKKMALTQIPPEEKFYTSMPWW